MPLADEISENDTVSGGGMVEELPPPQADVTLSNKKESSINGGLWE